MKKISIAALALSLIACARTTYIPPTSGETATLITPKKISSYQAIGGVASVAVQFALKGEDGCGNTFALEAPAKPEDTTLQYKIPSTSNIFVAAYYSFGNNYCSIALEFEPMANKTYDAEIFLGKKPCTLLINEIQPTGERKKIQVKVASIDTWTGQKICSI
ncbi:hypothetical protein TDB9533_00594 [Thalassocella blandensis]|nr:hypothetical protein TDB9533_00594 [Thalassocella blandensis]